MLKKLSILGVGLLVAANASTSISRYFDNTINDYGTNDPAKVINKFAKDVVLVNASLKALPDKIAYEQREITSYKCDSDNDGGEACTYGRQTCSDQTFKSSGDLTTEKKYLEQLPHTLKTHSHTTCNDHYLSLLLAYNASTRVLMMRYYNASPNHNFGHNCGGNHFTEQSYQLPQEVVNKSASNLRIYISSRGGGCTNRDRYIVVNLNALPSSFNLPTQRGSSRYDRNPRMYPADLGGYYFYNVAYCGASGAQHPTVFLQFPDYASCTDPKYTLTPDKTKCILEYTYQYYKCPNSTSNEPISFIDGKYYTWGHNSKWIGPLNYKGNGDCTADKLNEKMECPAPEYPGEDNCQRRYKACPGADDVSCYKAPSGSPIASTGKDSGVVGSFKTVRGTAQTYARKNEISPKCPAGMKFDAEGYCYRPASATSCPSGYTIKTVRDVQRCVKEVSFDDKCQAFTNSEDEPLLPSDYPDLNIPSGKKLCATSVSGSCNMGEDVTPDGTKCVASPICDNKGIIENGKCVVKYTYTDYICPSGYTPTSAGSNDCKGDCGGDGCACNNPTPPVDSCKIDAGFGNAYETYETSPLLRHNISGAEHNIAEWGSVEGEYCGGNDGQMMPNCPSDIGMIEGDGEHLCFTNNRGEKTCYRVNNCTFTGKMGGVGQEIQSFKIGNGQRTIEPVNGDSHAQHSQIQGVISSNCKMNGHMGWKNRSEGFTSIRIAPTDSRRLEFWDSYMDGAIGYLDFIGDLTEEQSKAGYQLEDLIPSLMADQGFTSIDYSVEIGKTIYVSPNGSCGNAYSILRELEPQQVSYSTIQNKDYFRKLGAEPQSCIMISNGNHSFAKLKSAAKINKNAQSFTYMCSPYLCNGGRCQLAKCPVVEVDIAGQGVKKVEFQGKIYPATFDTEISRLQQYYRNTNQKIVQYCTAQTCDGNRPLVDVCGYKYQPSFRSGNFVTRGGINYEYYCKEGILSPDGVHCEVKKCPDDMKEGADGFCYKK